MSLDNVVSALGALSKNQQNDGSPVSKHDEIEVEERFFCVEDTFLTSEIQVFVNDVGLVNFPIDEDTIEKLIISEKATFDAGKTKFLKTCSEESLTIPAAKLNVCLDERSLEDVLKRLGQALNIGRDSKLETNLTDMTIYGPGQSTKRKRDTEHLPNVVATLVMVLPCIHKGGDLVIQHCGVNHTFFGSRNHQIIKCVAFSSYYYHKVQLIEEGYRVTLTYNIELKYGPCSQLVPVDESLKAAVETYFDHSNSDKLVYYLDHQYTTQNLRWHMLKGTDQTCALALLSLGKKCGYYPCLALADYHERIEEDYDAIDVELYFWVDENNLEFEQGRISLRKNETCFFKDTREAFKPYKTEEGKNECVRCFDGGIDQWYHRSCIVLWSSRWHFSHGYKKELYALQQLTTQPGMQETLLQEIEKHSKDFFSIQFWGEPSVGSMLFDIVTYLNDKNIAIQILSKLNPEDVLNLSWMAETCDLETWTSLIDLWKATPDSTKLLNYILSFLQIYLSRDDKNIQIAEYLLKEAANLFKQPKRSDSTVVFFGNCIKNDRDKNHQLLCSLLRLSFKLGNPDIESTVIGLTIENIKTAADYKSIEELLSPEEFERVSKDLLMSLINSSLTQIGKGCLISDISSLLEISMSFSDEATFKILSKLSPRQVLEAAKSETVMTWLVDSVNLEAWKILIDSWKSLYNFNDVINSLLTFITRIKYLEITDYMLSEIANSSAFESMLLSPLLQVCFKFNKIDLEKRIVANLTSATVEDYISLKSTLHPEQFSRISNDLFSKVVNFHIPHIDSIQDVSSLLETSINSNLAVATQIFLKLNPLQVMTAAKNNAIMEWITKCCDLEIWRTLSNSWKISYKSDGVMNCLLSILSDYLFKDGKNDKIADFLFTEAVNLFLQAKEANCSNVTNSQLIFFLQVCSQLDKLDLEKQIVQNLKLASSAPCLKTVADYNLFQKTLHPEQFARISGHLLLKIFYSCVDGEVCLPDISLLLDISISSGQTFVATEILLELKIDQLRYAAKNIKISTWITSTCDLNIWKTLVNKWKSSNDSDGVMNGLLLLLANHFINNETSTEIKEYLFAEAANLFIQAKEANGTKVTNAQLQLLLRVCFKLQKTDLEKKIVTNLISAFSAPCLQNLADFQMFKQTLHPEQFARISGDLLLRVANFCVGQLLIPPYIYMAPNENCIRDMYALLETSAPHPPIEQGIMNYMISASLTYNVSFLSKLLIELKKSTVIRKDNYKELAKHTLLLIEQELENPENWTLPVTISCQCQFCIKIKMFFSSTTLKQLIIPTSQKNRKHIQSSIKLLMNLPIQVETIRLGSPYKLSISKLPKLLQDRQVFLKQLLLSKEIIVQAYKMNTRSELVVYSTSATKKQKLK